MKYAVILLNDNSWQLESDDEDEATKFFWELKLSGEPCVMVEVLRSTEED